MLAETRNMYKEVKDLLIERIEVYNGGRVENWRNKGGMRVC